MPEPEVITTDEYLNGKLVNRTVHILTDDELYERYEQERLQNILEELDYIEDELSRIYPATIWDRFRRLFTRTTEERGEEL